MAFGLLALDAIYWVGLLGLITLSASVVQATYEWALASATLPSSVAVAIALPCGALAWILTVAVLSFLVPRPKPGRYPVLAHPVFFGWVVTFVLRRYLDLPPFQLIVYHTNLLRFVVLRLLGARVRLTTNMSSDAVILDPNLFTAGAESMLGAQTLVSGHLIVDNHLILAPIRLGDRVEVGGRAGIGPGVEVADDARIGAAVSLGLNVHVGAGAKIGPHAFLDAGVRVGAGARVAAHAYVPAGTVIEADAVYPAKA